MLRFAPLLIVVAALATFAVSIANEHVYDDVIVIQQNDRLNDALDVAGFFSTPFREDRLATALYRPLTLWSLAIDRAIFGPGPFGTHLVNILLNAIVAWLAWALIRKITASDLAALAGGLLFAVHPVHAEVVANGVGRAELGAAAGALAAILLHLKAFDHEGRARLVRLVGAMSFYLVSLLCKESGVMVPALIFGIDWLGRCEGRMSTALRRAWAPALYALPLAIYFVARFAVVTEGAPEAYPLFVDATVMQRQILAVDVLARYAGQLIVPVSLIADYADYRVPVRDLTLIDGWRVIGLVGLLAYGVWSARRGSRWLLMGTLFALVAIFPASNILIPIGSLRGDRLMYLPSFGGALIAGWCFLALHRRFKVVATIGLVVVTLLFAVRAGVRAYDWRDNETLCRVTLRDNPGCQGAWARLGEFELDKGNFDVAADASERAAQLMEGLGGAAHGARFNQAMALISSGHRDEGKQLLENIVAVRPLMYEAAVNLAGLRFEEGDTDAAEKHLRAAIESSPDRYMAYGSLTVVLIEAGKIDDANQAFRSMTDQGAPPALVNQIRQALRAAGE